MVPSGTQSQLFMAWGLPPDSCWMISQMYWASASLTLMPLARRMSIASLIHSWTLPGGGPPAGGPPLGPRPPPPPPWKAEPPPPPWEPPVVDWGGGVVFWPVVVSAPAGAVVVLGGGVGVHWMDWPGCGVNGWVFGSGMAENVLAGVAAVFSAFAAEDRVPPVP